MGETLTRYSAEPHVVGDCATVVFTPDHDGRWVKYDRVADHISYLRQSAATAERARLAALASEEGRAMVREVLESALRDDLGRRNRAETTLLATLAARRAEALGEAAMVCAPAMTRLKVLVRALDRGGESAWAAEAHAIYCELSNALTTPPGAGPKQTPPPEGAR